MESSLSSASGFALYADQKNLSHADIEKRTGLIRHYVSRIVNGHVVPSIEMLEKFARAFKVPLCQLFYDGEEAPAPLPAKRVAHAHGAEGGETILSARDRVF